MISVQIHHLTHAGMQDAADELGLEFSQYQELVALFLTRTADGLGELERALAQGDRAAAMAALHSIKGTALSMRLTMVAEPATAMESAVKAARTDDFPQELEALKAGLALLAAEAKGLGIEG
jgi:HPt (histidine-containing phosphotransfer) domain-containing protein